MIPFEDGYIDPKEWAAGIIEYIFGTGEEVCGAINDGLAHHELGKIHAERECLYTLDRLSDFWYHQLGYYKQGVN